MRYRSQSFFDVLPLVFQLIEVLTEHFKLHAPQELLPEINRIRMDLETIAHKVDEHQEEASKV